MEKKVSAFIQENRLLTAGDTVIVALSGGADSMALFHFLLTQQKQMGIAVAAAHFDHGLRGEESRRDSAFVQKVCAKTKTPLYLREGKMEKAQKPAGIGIEEWARKLRYAFLEELAGRYNAKIATAHTFSDNAETVLFHAIRGTGPRGLAGIAPVRGCIVRPLLAITRAEVEAYCQTQGLEYVTDSTNLQTDFTRNRIRLQALPLLEEIRPGAAKALGRLAGDMRELDEWITAQAGELLNKAKDGAGYSPDILLCAPGPVRLQALVQLAGPATGRGGLAQIEQVLCGKLGAVTLPGGKTVKLSKGKMLILPALAPGLPELGEFTVQEREYSFGKTCFFTVKILPRPQQGNFYPHYGKKGLTFWADYDKIAKAAIFRTRRPKDSFALPGRGVRKTLKKWMNEEGIVPEMRACMPFLCNGNDVLWAYGTGFCDSVKVDGLTRKILQIQQK